MAVLAVLLGLTRLGLSSVGVHRTRRAIARFCPRTSLPPERLAHLVTVACRVLPGATLCLARSIVLEALLVEAGHAAELRIGVTPLAGRERPGAHAWVELRGVAVTEGPSGYTALPLFGTRG